MNIGCFALNTPFSPLDVQLALGGGYGRVLDVGAAIRVRRIAHVLDGARALGKPIDAATARRLQLTWWALRDERSTYRALIATVEILREAGILLAEPGAGLSYELLAVLRDANLFVRPSGLDVQVTFGEGYQVREDSNRTGRIEQAFFAGSYAAQVAEDLVELTGGAFGHVRLFTDDNVAAPLAAGVFGRLRRFTYVEHGDPYGALDVSLVMRVSNDDRDVGNMMKSDLGSRIEAQVGFSWWVNPASGLRLAATVAEDTGKLFVGARLEATYGFLDGSYAGL
ncbi:MAG: hypothetical protein NT062_17835 [Proteobacteria bacterium]|nr:hypothetical protein [Pseudomonadota bacterium]